MLRKISCLFAVLLLLSSCNTNPEKLSDKLLISISTNIVGEKFICTSYFDWGSPITEDEENIYYLSTSGIVKITKKSGDYNIFKDALYLICEKVSRMIAFDGEGATKLLECRIINANSKNDAKKLAKSVIKSSLVKTMMFGADANGGRILCALGYAGIDFDPEKVDVGFKSSAGEIQLYKNGKKAFCLYAGNDKYYLLVFPTHESFF